MVFLHNRKDLNREYTQIGMAKPVDSVSQGNMFLKPIGGAVSLSHMTTPPWAVPWALHAAFLRLSPALDTFIQVLSTASSLKGIQPFQPPGARATKDSSLTPCPWSFLLSNIKI